MTDTRYTIFVWLVALIIGIFGFQLLRLQIIGRDDTSDVAESNALRRQRLVPARAAIYDRHGSRMVQNEPVFSVTLTPRYFDTDQVPVLAKLLGVGDSVVTGKLEEARNWSSYQPSSSFHDVSFEHYSHVLENIYRLPGVGDEVTDKRSYPSDARAAHALGYLSEINRSELDYRDSVATEFTYRQGDILGKTGLERKYEEHLRGIPGIVQRIVNVYGMEVGPYMDGEEDDPPRDIYSIHLALDSGIQSMAESLLVGKRGAVVAIDPNNGDIIALASAPDYPPDIFAQSLSRADQQSLFFSEVKPLYNRATMNLMPPGSAWKPFMALMALEEGLVSGPNDTINCPGYHPVGRGRIFRCLGTHGNQDLLSAIKNSCNTYFFELAKRMDLSRFKQYANRFGFGVTAPIDLLEQTPGLIPDSAYFEAKHPFWGIGTIMNLGIGQGDMGVTPLQLARYAATIANGGYPHAPRLVRELENVITGERIRPPGFSDPEETERIPIKEEYFEIVREGMRQTMTEGSGRASQIPGIETGGKTGTAQAPGIDMEDHSVFVMFAPFEDPTIAIAVQCENTGGGSLCAAPIASLLVEQYLTGSLSDSFNTTVRLERVKNAVSSPLR